MTSLFNLDNLCRDSEDGAYHCPSCNAPFTRRSNLRRHFVIHTRNMPFKCNSCGSRFSRSDELHYHVFSCPEAPWQDATDPSFPTIPRFLSDPVFNVMTPSQTDVTPSFLAQDLLPAISPSASRDADQAFADFMSCLSSPTSDTTQEYQVSNERIGATNSMLGSTNTNSRSSHRSPVVHQPSTTRTRLYPRRTSQPYSTLNRRKKLKDKPIYTRRQVDDMLNALGSCFAGTMEEVLKRVDANIRKNDKARDPEEDAVITVEGPNHELHKILSNTLPRLFNSLQNFLDQRTKAD